MKMIRGSSGATIADYGSYSSNCTLGQKPYKIPVNSLSDVQLYAEIGGQPDTIQYQLIHTCGPSGGTIEPIFPDSYVAGQDTNDAWYGVFKNFTGATPTCFVIAITVDYGGNEIIFFSEEYCVETNCGSTMPLIKGCYGNLDNLLSYNCQGIYFGVPAGDSIGDITLTYKHQLFLRGVEVTLSSIKNTFKQGRTRNFRTEKEKIYQFMAELVPEWYIPEVDAVFYRGEVFVGDTKYLVNETAFEKVEECKKQWKPTATFKDSCFQSFSCEANPCDPPVIESEIPESGEESGSGESENPTDVYIINLSGAGVVIEDVTGIAGFTLDDPVLGGGNTFGTHTAFTGVIGVTISGTPVSGSLSLRKNGVLLECNNIGAAGSYGFASQTFLEDDIIQVRWFGGAC